MKRKPKIQPPTDDFAMQLSHAAWRLELCIGFDDGPVPCEISIEVIRIKDELKSLLGAYQKFLKAKP